MAAAALCLLGAACVGAVSTGPFPDPIAAERQLHRGSATKAEVERLLGAPQGRGEALLPGQSGDPREVWFYQSVRIGPMVETSGPAQQQVMLVFFDGERFDGLVWWPTEGELGHRVGGVR